MDLSGYLSDESDANILACFLRDCTLNDRSYRKMLVGKAYRDNTKSP